MEHISRIISSSENASLRDFLKRNQAFPIFYRCYSMNKASLFVKLESAPDGSIPNREVKATVDTLKRLINRMEVDHQERYTIVKLASEKSIAKVYMDKDIQDVWEVMEQFHSDMHHEFLIADKANDLRKNSPKEHLRGEDIVWERLLPPTDNLDV
ncbi:MAG: hypothetical protein AAFU33_19185 [Bacteroidota bacterium]